MKPTIVARKDHCVSRSDISKPALDVLYALKKKGYAAYLVGGGVRDLLTGLKPKDFDVATDATPEQVRKLFRSSRIIGRRFRLVHVLFGRDVIEVATFRAGHDDGTGGETGAGGRIVRDNVFGTIEQDVQRRDFTVNALYYNIDDFSVVDYVGGLDDINKRTFRLIGDPVTRFEEDPVRIIRAARLSAKLGFTIEAETEHAMYECTDLLAATPPARMFDEILKLFQGGYGLASFIQLQKYELLDSLFPATAARIVNSNTDWLAFVETGLTNTDARVQEGKPITPAYLMAFMLWPRVQDRVSELLKQEKLSPVDAINAAADEVMTIQSAVCTIPKRFGIPMREIWTLQPRLEHYHGKRLESLLENRRFRAAYDFLCLRSTINPALKPLADWWTRYQEVGASKRQKMSNNKPAGTWGDAGEGGRRSRHRNQRNRRPDRNYNGVAAEPENQQRKRSSRRRSKPRRARPE